MGTGVVLSAALFFACMTTVWLRKRKDDSSNGQVLEMDSKEGRISIPIGEFHELCNKGEIPKEGEFRNLAAEDAKINKFRTHDFGKMYKSQKNDTESGLNRHIILLFY